MIINVCVYQYWEPSNHQQTPPSGNTIFILVKCFMFITTLHHLYTHRLVGIMDSVLMHGGTNGTTTYPLRWRHNGGDSVSNHQPNDCLLNRLFGANQSKHQSSASLAFVWGIHRDRWIPRTKGQLRGKCFHLMTSSCIWCRPYVVCRPFN